MIENLICVWKDAHKAKHFESAEIAREQINKWINFIYTR